MSNEQKHTPEPWPPFAEHVEINGVNDGEAPTPYHLLKRADYERARACVNACAGMDDPAAEIAKLRRDLEANIESRHMEGAAFNKCLHLRDELAAALIDVLDGCAGIVPLVQSGGDPTKIARDINRARSVLAKARP